MANNVEYHPLEPFLPHNAKVLMLGSFPPSKVRWSIEFFYPNFQNDMWRIFGLVFCNNKDAFVDMSNRKFCKERIVELLSRVGIALFDTAVAVVRTRGTASDSDLQIVQPTSVAQLLCQLPYCEHIVATGTKSAEVCAEQLNVRLPHVGEYAEAVVDGRNIKLWRMPSSSRAYPMKLERKAELYVRLLKQLE